MLPATDCQIWMGMWSWNGALPRRGWKSKTTTRGYFHHRSSQGSTNQEHQEEQGWVKWDQREWELFGVPIRCLLAEAELPQSRWLEGRHTTPPVPGDFQSAAGDSPQPHTASEQAQEELAGLRASPPASWGFLLSRNPISFTLSPPQGWTPPTTVLSHT